MAKTGMHTQGFRHCYTCNAEMWAKGEFQNVLHTDGKKHLTCPKCIEKLSQPKPEREVLDVLVDIAEELERTCTDLSDEEFLAIALGK